MNAGEGVYYFDVNLGEGTIKATKVETMGIIGQFNGWSGDAVMTWNAEEYCFEATKVGVTADGWKFRVMVVGTSTSVEVSITLLLVATTLQ